MAEQVLIEFIGDTTKLEQAYNELNQLVQNFSKLNKQSLADFQKANKDAADSLKNLNQNFGKASTSAGDLFNQFKDLDKKIPSKVLMDASTGLLDLANGALAASAANGALTKDLTALSKQLQQTGKNVADSGGGFETSGEKLLSLQEQLKKTPESAEALKSLTETLTGIKTALDLTKESAVLFGGQNETISTAVTKVEAALKAVEDAQALLTESTKEGTVANKAAAAAQALYTFAVGESGGAMKVFRLAFASTGIGLLIIAIGTLIANWDKLKEAVKSNSEAFNNFSKSLLVLTPTIGVLAKQLQLLYQYFDDIRAVMGGVAQAAGVLFSKLGDAVGLLFEGNFSGAANKFKNIGAEMKQAFADGMNQKKVEIQLDKDIANAKDVLALAEAQGKGVYEAKVKYLKLELQALDKRTQDYKIKEAELTKFILDEHKKRNDDAEAKRMADLQDEEKGINAKLKLVGNNIEEEKKLRYKQAELERRMMDENPNATENEKADARADYLAKTIEIDKNYANEKKAIADADNKAWEEVKHNREQDIELQKAYRLSQQQIDEEFEAYSQNRVNANYDDFVTDLKKRLDAQKDADKDSVKQAQETQDKISQVSKDGAKTEAQIAEEKAAVKEKNEASAEEQAITGSIKLAHEISDAVFQVEAEQRQAKLDADLKALDDRKQRELSNKFLTEAQKSAIDKKYRKEEAALKLKAWQADKQAKVIQAVINTALGIANAFATAPWPVSIAQAALAAASGAVQVAVIESQPTPQFAKGTKKAPAGFKWVGEAGPELINDKGGYAIISHPDSMKLLQQYDIPAMPAYTLPMPDVPEAHQILNTHLSSPNNIDYPQLGKVIAEKLKQNPQVVVNMDKGGFTTHILEKGRAREVLNNRYES